METPNTKITIETLVNAPIDKIWKMWTNPDDVVHWNHASDDWRSPTAENDLRTGGKFNYRMEAKDGSFGFDFAGVYDLVEPHKKIIFTMADNRKVEIIFKSYSSETEIIETFDAENENPIEMQREGWQAILNNFKKYAEGK
jgi:uncharacterized protein YndB with AHSA1/START domain